MSMGMTTCCLPHYRLDTLFLMAYIFAKRLKTLRGLTPYEYICQYWHKEPERFTINPYHHTLGLRKCKLISHGFLPLGLIT